MGECKHHTIVVTGNDCSEIYAEAQRIGMILSPLVEGHSNGYVSFCVFPDGSNEKSRTSNIFDDKRAEFVQILKTYPVDWIEVSFGGDGGKAEIVSEAGQQKVIREI